MVVKECDRMAGELDERNVSQGSAGLYLREWFMLLTAGLLLAACTNHKEEPAVSVPADCQQFLNNYFGAWKSKDVGTLQSLSFYLSPEERSRLPEGSVELWRQSKDQLVTENFHRVSREFGDFKQYKVLMVKTTMISPQDQPAANDRLRVSY
jgi:hypothetical protein